MIKFNQTGFTLVEIAIVLVIIGLLLGGILKGQELINSARVRNLADQNSAVQAAYFGFIDRYRQVPGDMSPDNAERALGVEINSGGNENGRIDRDDWEEAAAVWEHLSKAGFITGNYEGGSDAASYFNNAPTNAFNGRVVLSQFEGNGTDYQGTGSLRLGFMFGLQVPVNVMRELDVKLDDGNPTGGVVRAAAPDAEALSDVTAQPSGATECVTTVDGRDIWDVQANSQDCNAVYLY